jgi:hypothetical protein
MVTTGIINMQSFIPTQSERYFDRRYMLPAAMNGLPGSALHGILSKTVIGNHHFSVV